MSTSITDVLFELFMKDNPNGVSRSQALAAIYNFRKELERSALYAEDALVKRAVAASDEDWNTLFERITEKPPTVGTFRLVPKFTFDWSGLNRVIGESLRSSLDQAVVAPLDPSEMTLTNFVRILNNGNVAHTSNGDSLHFYAFERDNLIKVVIVAEDTFDTSAIIYECKDASDAFLMFTPKSGFRNFVPKLNAINEVPDHIERSLAYRAFASNLLFGGMIRAENEIGQVQYAVRKASGEYIIYAIDREGDLDLYPTVRTASVSAFDYWYSGFGKAEIERVSELPGYLRGEYTTEGHFDDLLESGHVIYMPSNGDHAAQYVFRNDDYENVGVLQYTQTDGSFVFFDQDDFDNEDRGSIWEWFQVSRGGEVFTKLDELPEEVQKAYEKHQKRSFERFNAILDEGKYARIWKLGEGKRYAFANEEKLYGSTCRDHTFQEFEDRDSLYSWLMEDREDEEIESFGSFMCQSEFNNWLHENAKPENPSQVLYEDILSRGKVVHMSKGSSSLNDYEQYAWKSGERYNYAAVYTDGHVIVDYETDVNEAYHYLMMWFTGYKLNEVDAVPTNVLKKYQAEYGSPNAVESENPSLAYFASILKSGQAVYLPPRGLFSYGQYAWMEGSKFAGCMMFESRESAYQYGDVESFYSWFESAREGEPFYAVSVPDPKAVAQYQREYGTSRSLYF